MSERPESLQRWLSFIGIAETCRGCEYTWRPLGKLHGVNMGHGWVRITTAAKCPEHGKRT